MIHVEKFLDEVRRNKQTSLIVLACSGRKREDLEIEQMLPRNLQKLEEEAVLFDESVSRLLEDFRRCTMVMHGNAVEKSKEYPAYLRYSGSFYNSVWDNGGFDVWEKVIKDMWKVLILSAYYGFLKITDPISDYNLQISRLNAGCKQVLPKVLDSIIKTNGVEKVYLLTSKEYSKPFKNKLDNLYRVVLLDRSDMEIRGAYGTEYYSEAGKLFTSLVTSRHIPGKTNSIELEEI